MSFRDHQKALTMGNQIVIGIDNRGTLISIDEHLCFHGIQTQTDRLIDIVYIGLKDVFYICLLYTSRCV